MNLSKKQIITTIFTLAIVFAIPIALYLSRQRQTIQPRALQGKANFLLSTESISSSVGKDINVLVSLQLTDPSLKVSGVDFLLLYDKEKLDVGKIVTNSTRDNPTANPPAPFTDVPIVTSGGSFDCGNNYSNPNSDDCTAGKYNFVRVTEVARRNDAGLPTGTFQLAKITFQGRGAGGQATIKFPDDNKYLEISGTGTYNGPTAVPGSPTITPGGPTITPSVNACNWGGPLSYSPTLAGTGTIQAQSDIVLPGNILRQVYWRGDQEWIRTVPIVNNTVNWSGALAWVAGPDTYATLAGTGSIQSYTEYVLGNAFFIGYWRGDQGWTKTVPLVNGVLDWANATAWSGPINTSILAGSGTIEDQSAVVLANSLYQTYWRGTQQWVRSVPIVNGVVNWNSASAWQAGMSLANLAGSGNIQTYSEFSVGNSLWQAYWRGDQGWYRILPMSNGNPDWSCTSQTFSSVSPGVPTPTVISTSVTPLPTSYGTGQAPMGWLDVADCTWFAGWSADQDNVNSSNLVSFYADGPAGTGTLLGTTTASGNRPDVCTAFGWNQSPCSHGFSFSTPQWLKNGQPHQIYAVGINLSGTGTNNTQLSGAPKTITCSI